jgi:hypothetical protein
LGLGQFQRSAQACQPAADDEGVEGVVCHVRPIQEAVNESRT